MKHSLSFISSRNSLHTGYASTYSTPRPSRDSARHPTAAYHQPSSAYSPSTTTTSYTSYTARQPTYNDRSSIVTADAPPAYTPSPTSPLTRLSSASDYSTNYRTFQSTNIASNMGRREESQGLLANEPQSMGAPNDDLEDASPLWRNRVKRRLPHSILRHCKVALIALLLLLVTVGFITSLLSGMRDQVSFIRHAVLFVPSLSSHPKNGIGDQALACDRCLASCPNEAQPPPYHETSI
ncbi:hypothetical protein B0T19DRAFT_267408 [Cercophora scortea]|uniref:Uncharacterized protein n=1 Tax=Cercophora scortea TaxID=314031 RepID=A0AAE0M856_9PEZI|nr:hypothetical protein B0T19DRAFT_267408 [Cercophora scortea]